MPSGFCGSTAVPAAQCSTLVGWADDNTLACLSERPRTNGAPSSAGLCLLPLTSTGTLGTPLRLLASTDQNRITDALAAPSGSSIYVALSNQDTNSIESVPVRSGQPTVLYQASNSGGSDWSIDGFLAPDGEPAM